MYVAKTKALISCAVTEQLICAFVFAYAKVRFFHDTALFIKPSHTEANNHSASIMQITGRLHQESNIELRNIVVKSY